MRSRRIEKNVLKEKRKRWEEGERQTLALLLVHPRFQHKILEARVKLRIGELKKTEEELAEWEQGGVDGSTMSDSVDWDIWQQAMEHILDFFGLTYNYLEAIHRYVLMGTFDGANTRKIRVITDRKRRLDGVTLKILAPASKEEIMEAVMFANKQMNLLLKREDGKVVVTHVAGRWKTWKFRTKLERDLEIYQRWKWKGGESGPQNDIDIAVDMFDGDPVEDLDIARIKDKRLAKQIPLIVKRIDKALRERFPEHTFWTKK